MALVDADRFADVEVGRIYIAGRLSEARSVEALLSESGIDYCVEIEKFGRRLLGLIPREYNGVAFYVADVDASRGRQVLETAGFVKGLTDG
jgi:hypothetical protein